MQRKISSYYTKFNCTNGQQIKEYIYNSISSKLFPNIKYSIPIILAYIILTLIFTYPVLLSDTLIPGGGDAYFYLWDLWWYKEALLNFSSPYWTPYLFHPTGLPLAFSAITPFNGIVSIPLQLIFGTIRTYNILWTGSFIIAGYGSYLLVNYLTGDSKAAFVSGLIFMFSPYHFAHALGHLNLLSIEWIPFYVLYLFKTLKEPELKNAVFAGIFLLFVALSEYTYLIYLLIFTSLTLLYLLYTDRKYLINRTIIQRLSILSITFGITFFPFAYPLLKELISSQSDYMYSGGFVTFSADLMGYFIPSQLHPILGDLVDPFYQNFTGNIAEYTVFAGYTVLLLALLAVVKIRTKEIRFWVLSLGTFFVLSLGPLLHFNGVITGTIEGIRFAIPLPYSLIMQIPILSIARAPSRCDVIVMLALSVLAGYGLHYIYNVFNEKRVCRIHVNSLLSVIFTTFILFEFLAIPFPISNSNVPDFYYSLSKDPDCYAIYEIPDMAGHLSFPEYMYYQTVHGKKLLTGYTHIPDYVTKFSKETPFIKSLHMEYTNSNYMLAYNKDIFNQNSSETAQSTLNYYDVRYIVLHTNLLTNEQLEFAEHLLQSNLNTDPIIYKNDSLIVYKVPTTSIKPIITLDAGWHGLENWSETPTRWTTDDATLFTHTNDNCTVTMSLQALSFHRPRTVEIYANDQLVQRTTVPTSFSHISIPIQLHKGENTIRFHVPEGAERPCDIPELNNRDTRRLSVAVQNVTLIEAE
jgi:hypothetical protein